MKTLFSTLLHGSNFAFYIFFFSFIYLFIYFCYYFGFHPVLTPFFLLRPFPLTVFTSLKVTVSICYKDVLKRCRSVHLSAVCLSVRLSACLSIRSVRRSSPLVPSSSLHSPRLAALPTKCMIKCVLDSRLVNPIKFPTAAH